MRTSLDEPNGPMFAAPLLSVRQIAGNQTRGGTVQICVFLEYGWYLFASFRNMSGH
jgi:hypothetical protein